MALNFIFTADGSRYTRGLEKMRGQTERWSSSMSKTIVKAFAGGVVIAGIKKLITSASDLSETVQKSRVIFGENSAAVEAWAGSLASSFGISQQAALEAAASFSSMFNILGIGSKESEAMGKTLVELASDMASFHNTSIEQAIRAIGSGLRGEMEPLRKFNVLLNEATLKQEALSQGLTTGKGKLELSARAQAAYSLILKQSEVASGDFKRTSDGLANSMKILAAESENASAKVGGKLLPVAERITAVFKGAAATLADWALGGIANFNAVVASATQAAIEISSVISSIGKALKQVFERDFEKAAKTMERVAERNEESGERIARAWREARAEAFLGADARAPGAGAGQAPPGGDGDIIKQLELEKKIAAAKEKLAKASFDALEDEAKMNELLEERSKIIGGLNLFSKTGSEEELKNIEIQTRLEQISKEVDTLKERDERRVKKIQDEAKKDDKIRSEAAKVIKEAEDEAPIKQIISTTLTSIGGGAGGVAAIADDPILAAQERANKILEKIERNTTPATGVPLTPEL